MDGTQIIAGGIPLKSKPKAGFGARALSVAMGTPAITLFENLCYTRSFNRTEFSPSQPKTMPGTLPPGMPRVTTTNFDGPVDVSSSELRDNAGVLTVGQSMDQNGDATSRDQITADGRNTQIYLPNGRRTTAHVVEDNADGTVATGDGTVIPAPGGLTTVGVRFTLLTDAMGHTHVYTPVGSSKQPGNYTINGNGAMVQTGLSATNGVALSSPVDHSPCSGFPATVAADVTTAHLHCHSQGQQFSESTGIQMCGGQMDRAFLENWLENHPDGATTLGTSRERKDYFISILVKWFNEISTTWRNRGMTEEEAWRLTDRINRAICGLRDPNASTAAAQRRPWVDKRTMTKEQWAELDRQEGKSKEPVEEERGFWRCVGDVLAEHGKGLVEEGLVSAGVMLALGPLGPAVLVARAAYKAIEAGSRMTEAVVEVASAYGRNPAVVAEAFEMAAKDPRIQAQVAVSVAEALVFRKCAQAANSCRWGGMNCFVAGTLVWVLKDGITLDEALALLALGVPWWVVADLVPIEAILAGQYVLSRHESSEHAPLTFSRVDETYERVASNLVSIEVGSTTSHGTLVATEEHPFWVSSALGGTVPLADATLSGQTHTKVYANDQTGGSQSAGSGWVFAGDLKAGYSLATAAGGRLDVKSVSGPTQKATTVYNLAVQDTASYFVAAAGAPGLAVWVHNAKYGKKPGSSASTRINKHHTVPKEVLKMLPPEVANHPAVRGRRGAPNRWPIPEDLHKAIHEGAGGGAYNEVFKARIRQLGRTPTVEDVLRIRDGVVKDFGLGEYRP